MRWLRMAGLVAGMALAATSAPAGVLVSIDKTAQRMTVAVDGRVAHVWPVSTGRAGFGTPNGRYRPQRLARTWFSRKYYNSPMPHSIFFHRGYAIHGSHDIRRLGGPASHGCVRLHPAHAATLFALVKREGVAATRITIHGANPPPAAQPRRPRMAPPPRGPGYDDRMSVYRDDRPLYRGGGWGGDWWDD